MKGSSQPVPVSDVMLTLSEEHLLREIAHFDLKALEHTRDDTPLSRALATVYRYSADEKREALAALRERGTGVPAKFLY